MDCFFLIQCIICPVPVILADPFVYWCSLFPLFPQPAFPLFECFVVGIFLGCQNGTVSRILGIWVCRLICRTRRLNDESLARGIVFVRHSAL
jgi:hypothetical protein